MHLMKVLKEIGQSNFNKVSQCKVEKCLSECNSYNHRSNNNNHLFNRLQDCCLSLMHHLNDIADYLNANSTIINNVAILDRSFSEMEFLKPIYGAIAFLRLHITRPFHTLLIDPSTTYSTPMVSFKRLYKDLTEIPAKSFLTTNLSCLFCDKEYFRKIKTR